MYLEITREEKEMLQYALEFLNSKILISEHSLFIFETVSVKLKNLD